MIAFGKSFWVHLLIQRKNIWLSICITTFLSLTWLNLLWLSRVMMKSIIDWRTARDPTVLSIARYKDSVRQSKTLSDFTKDCLLYNAGLRYKFQQKSNSFKQKMKLLKYFTAVVLTLASEGDQEPPGVALKNCRTELGFQINNSTDARSCAS